jgi:multidrug efflux system outer membrane protein
MRPLLILACAALPLAGCVTLGPDYQRPEPPAASQWRQPLPADAAGSVDETLAEDWWRAFDDPALDALIARAAAGSPRLALAAARVAEARAVAGRAAVEHLPEFGANARASKGQQLASFGVGDGKLDTESRSLSATVSYELDLWGRLRRLDEAARAQLLSSEASARAVQLALVADLTRAWYSRAALLRERTLFEDNLTRRREALELQQLRFDAGVIAGVDYDRAAAELAATEAALPAIEQALARTENRLAVLLGEAPAGAEIPPAPEALIEPPAVPVGLPSSLLERRPDLIAAEGTMIAANARIGAAKAALFPSLALTGSFGYESVELGGVISASGTVWNIGADLLATLFDFGRRQRDVEASRARAEQAVYLWRGAILDAFSEVEDALVGVRTARQRETSLQRQAEALQQTLEAEQQRYEAGDSGYLEVLDAERFLLSARTNAINARRDALLATVDLVQALGGGWPAAGAEEASLAD